MLQRICGNKNESGKRGETACNKEFHNLYTSVNINRHQINKDKMGGTYRIYEQAKKAHKC